MSMLEDPADVDLDRSSLGSPVLTPPPRDMRIVGLIGICGILALAGAGVYFFKARPQPQPAAAAPAKAESHTLPAPQPEPGENIDLPPLDATDTLLRQLVGKLSSNPAVAAWLAGDGLIVNFAVVTSKIADGEAPGSELKTIGPLSSFKAATSRRATYIDPSSYHRYDRFAEAISALDARGCARLYATVKPRINDASKRLGASNESFDPVLERAIVQMLRVPVLGENVALEPKGIGYAFADPNLEKLSGSQKQLLRMGPQNVRIVQAKLREIATYLAIPESRLPSPAAPPQ